MFNQVTMNIACVSSFVAWDKLNEGVISFLHQDCDAIANSSTFG